MKSLLLAAILLTTLIACTSTQTRLAAPVVNVTTNQISKQNPQSATVTSSDNTPSKAITSTYNTQSEAITSSYDVSENSYHSFNEDEDSLLSDYKDNADKD